MILDLYVPGSAPRDARTLDTPANTKRLLDPKGYLPDPGLTRAVNIALALGRPLLVSGEPGTGKTVLGFNVAWQLGIASFIYSLKSDSVARDLYYRYDTLARFHDVQIRRGDSDPLRYVSLSSLGMAIVGTLSPNEVPRQLFQDSSGRGPERAVVILDEIDKAPRDVPNDILHDLEHMSFSIPEAGGLRIAGDPELVPFVIFTTNSERSLPDAFLRRCVYYHIPFPSMDHLREIVASRVEAFVDGGPLLDQALKVFQALRSPTSGIRKRPGTAELLDWLRVIEILCDDPQASLEDIPDWEEDCAATLSKTSEDQLTVRGVLARLREESNSETF